MDIHQLIAAMGGDIRALADRLGEPISTVRKWRDRGKISRRGLAEHRRKFANILKKVDQHAAE